MKTIKIQGTIINNSDKDIYDWFGMEATSPNVVQLGLADANGLDIHVEINSPGGDLYAGSEIYTMLKSYKGTVRIDVTGIAASAASIIAMAGDVVRMSPTAQMMIHNVWTYAEGDAKTFEKEAETLRGLNEGVANAYILKTGKEKEELLKLMDNETYFNAQKALENGFIDEIMFNEENKIAASTESSMIPAEIVSKMRNFLKKEEEQILNQSKAKLKLLKLMEVK